MHPGAGTNKRLPWMNTSLPVRDNYAIAKCLGGGTCGRKAGRQKNNSDSMIIVISIFTNDMLFWEEKMKLSSELSLAS